MSSARAGRPRKAFVAVAFAALSLLLVTPVCDAVAALAAHPQPGSVASHVGVAGYSDEDGNHDSSGCCSTIEGSTLVKPANSFINGESDGAWGVPHVPVARALETVHRSRSDFMRGAPPPPKSFYARSARIRQ